MNKKLLVLIPLIASLCSCSSLKGEWYDYSMTEAVNPSSNAAGSSPFNTVMRLRYFLHDSNSDEDNETIKNEITNIYHDNIIRLHKTFDRHYNYSEYEETQTYVTNVKTINDSYGTNKEVIVSDELYSLLKQGVEYTKLTKGYFNILSGGLTDFWDNILSNYVGAISLEEDPYYNKENAELIDKLVAAIPTYEQIDDVLVFNDENKTIQFNEFHNEFGLRPYITVGGIAKGYATEIVKDLLNEKGYYDGILYSGGSSITSLGTPIYDNKIGQVISIVDPNSQSFMGYETAYSFALKEEFNVSTSGNYTQGKSYWFVPEEKEEAIYRHHIINPMTGYPENHYRSVTIISNTFDASIVDALSTALTNMTLEDGLLLKDELLKNNPNYDLDILYLSQTGLEIGDYQLTVTATSDIDGTLKGEKGVNIVYEA